MFETRDGYFWSSQRLDHPLIRRYRSKWRFPLHPETVLKILQDIPELREYLDYKFYDAWVNSLKRTNSIKKRTDFEFDYEFKMEPFDHQRKAIAFIRSLPACGLFMETGTGKTYCALVSTEMRIRKGMVKKALVIAPASVLKTGWFDDCQKFTDLKAMIVHPNKQWPWYCDECGTRHYSKEGAEDHMEREGHTSAPPHPEISWYNLDGVRDRIYAKGYDIYITSPHLAHRYSDDFLNARFDLVILDESTMIKSPSSKMGKAIKAIGHAADYRLAMTGTPVTNSLEDIWNQMKFVDMSFEDSISHFRNKYFWQHPVHHYIRNPHSWAPEAVMDRIKDRCLFIKKQDCLDLPDRMEIVREVPVNKECLKVYKKFYEDLYAKHGNKEISADNVLTEALRLHQIINGFVSNEDGTRHIISKKPAKIKELKNIMESVDSKVIIWAVYKHDFWAIEHYLSKYNPAVVAGKTSNVEAQVEKFKNDDTCRIMVAHPKSAKFGHTWNWAPVTIFYSYGYSVEDYWQARDRNYRIGQGKKVTEIFLCSGGIELRILNAIRGYEEFAKATVERLSID